jgi:hypothetical protein
MSKVLLNDYGVPQYKKGHTGRLLVTLAAIDTLDNPTSSSIAERTGLSKGNIDTYVAALNDQLRTKIVKDGPEFTIESWGDLLNPDSVRRLFSGNDHS